MFCWYFEAQRFDDETPVFSGGAEKKSLPLKLTTKSTPEKWMVGIGWNMLEYELLLPFGDTLFAGGGGC